MNLRNVLRFFKNPQNQKVPLIPIRVARKVHRISLRALNNAHGQALIQVMAAAAVSSIVILGMARYMASMQTQMTNMEVMGDVASIANSLSQALGSSQSCLGNLQASQAGSFSAPPTTTTEVCSATPLPIPAPSGADYLDLSATGKGIQFYNSAGAATNNYVVRIGQPAGQMGRLIPSAIQLMGITSNGADFTGTLCVHFKQPSGMAELKPIAIPGVHLTASLSGGVYSITQCTTTNQLQCVTGQYNTHSNSTIVNHSQPPITGTINTDIYFDDGTCPSAGCGKGVKDTSTSPSTVALYCRAPHWVVTGCAGYDVTTLTPASVFMPVQMISNGCKSPVLPSATAEQLFTSCCYTQ